MPNRITSSCKCGDGSAKRRQTGSSVTSRPLLIYLRPVPCHHRTRNRDAAFRELLLLELGLRKIEDRVDSVASFFDPYNAFAVLPTLGFSWWDDILPMVEPPTGQGYMPLRNITMFLGMVQSAKQDLPSCNEIERSGRQVGKTNDIFEWHDHFRQQRRRLIEFLGMAVKMKEPIWCDL